MRGATAHLVVRRPLRVPASLLATDVLPALDDACVLEGAPEDLLERRVAAQHASLKVGEDQVRGRRLDGGPEIHGELLGDWDRLRATALGRIPVVRAADDDETAYSGHRDHPDRSIVITGIGAS
jgi:hypothetical protein